MSQKPEVLISYVETNLSTFKPFVVWSKPMTELFGQLRGNQYEINNLLSRLLIEQTRETARVNQKLGDLQNEIDELRRSQV